MSTLAAIKLQRVGFVADGKEARGSQLGPSDLTLPDGCLTRVLQLTRSVTVTHSVECDQDGPSTSANCWWVLPAKWPLVCCTLQLRLAWRVDLLRLCPVAYLDDLPEDLCGDVLDTAADT
jgi:hypothetical protein